MTAIAQADGDAGSVHHEVVGQRLLGIIVCSSGTEDEALDWVRVHSPAGTMNNWAKVEDPAENQRPLPCADGKGTHFFFIC